MQVLHYNKKCHHVTTIVKFHIYKGSINDKQVNEKHTITNKIFGTTVESEALKRWSEYTTILHLNHPKRVQ